MFLSAHTSKHFLFTIESHTENLFSCAGLARPGQAAPAADSQKKQ